ncbi:hypothetical protein [Sulfurospirillum arcachonense]|uniref:hypothetical protein n=1 Tax=Sulfurospirillum arcachonense TaxID=57666 RepID=UPI00146FA39C|nr:hypothetical protein [Sulfurospirillum arcachonense]
MMQSPINRRQINVHKYKKYEKKEETPFNKELLKPDPHFIDERKVEKEEDKGFFSKLLGL